MRDNQQPSSRAFIVYKITNCLNGKCYIGITGRSLSARWSSHLERARSGERKSNRLYAALSKYGPESFRIEKIAETSTEDEVRKLETLYITKFDTFNKGYNCNLGGAGFLNFPPHIRKKISKAQIGKVISAEARARMSLAKMGDKSCAKNFGVHAQRGNKNPRARPFLVRFPDGSEHVIVGLRDFCRRHNIAHCKLSARGRTKGYSIVKRFNDYPEREYAQAGGNGGGPALKQDQDIVCSAR